MEEGGGKARQNWVELGEGVQEHSMSFHGHVRGQGPPCSEVLDPAQGPKDLAGWERRAEKLSLLEQGTPSLLALLFSTATPSRPSGPYSCLENGPIPLVPSAAHCEKEFGLHSCFFLHIIMHLLGETADTSGGSNASMLISLSHRPAVCTAACCLCGRWQSEELLGDYLSILSHIISLNCWVNAARKEKPLVDDISTCYIISDSTQQRGNQNT